ncbi:MAG: galactokinase [Chloroflexota bacterium]|nr:MAG: galactokinase [Chloroflexota bacterium]
MTQLEILVSEFQRLYGAPPEKIARAPGRVNLIGEHTDYNDGLVMPIAIDRDVFIAARARDDKHVSVTALDVQGGQTDTFALDDIPHHPDYRWANYVRGVTYYLSQQHVNLTGIDAVITSNLPSGAGLSSSAALEVCTATILQAFTSQRLNGVTIAQICQQAENNFVGVKSGIMDQFASALGQKDAAIKIDCRALTYETIKLPRGVTIVVADTNKKRHLAGSDYNTRRMECENAVILLGELLNRHIPALRDVSLKEFNSVANHLPTNLMKRARHVITENERVESAARAAKRNDAPKFGALMNESQTSLRDDFEASSPELDIMVEIARAQPGCLGSRLTGAGWGGATVNLVRDANVRDFVINIAREYHARTAIEPWVSPVRASPGAGIIGSAEREGTA